MNYLLVEAVSDRICHRHQYQYSEGIFLGRYRSLCHKDSHPMPEWRVRETALTTMTMSGIDRVIFFISHAFSFSYKLFFQDLFHFYSKSCHALDFCLSYNCYLRFDEYKRGSFLLIQMYIDIAIKVTESINKKRLM